MMELGKTTWDDEFVVEAVSGYIGMLAIDSGFEVHVVGPVRR
jgi:hypothetical protein